MLSAWGNKSHTERGYFLIEKHAFLSAFIVRKLFDNHKVTDAVRARSVEVRFFPAEKNVIRGISSVIGKSFLDEVYDVDTSEAGSLDVRGLVNQIIHSFFFVVVPSDTDETYLFFNSDRTKENFVVELPLARYVQILTSIACDHVQCAAIGIDEATGKVRVVLT
jgi:hypothetical protein